MSQSQNRVICSSKIQVLRPEKQQTNAAAKISTVQITPLLKSLSDNNGSERLELSSESPQGRGAKFRKISENRSIASEQPVNLSQLLQTIQTHNPSTFVTLTDITQEKVIVQEATMHNLLKAVALNSITFNPYFDVSNESSDESDNEFIDNVAVHKIEKFIHYICPQCGDSFKKYTKWLQHINKEHNINHSKYGLDILNFVSTTNKEGRNTYKCIDCDFEFSHNSNFTCLAHKIHQIPHSRCFKCKLCGWALFYCKDHISLHLKLEHSIILNNIFNESKYLRMRCPLCLEFEANEKRLYFHLESRHDYFRKAISQFTTHQNWKTCNLCGHTLYKLCNRNILLHMLSHELIESYNCVLCNTFATVERRNLIVHLKDVHFVPTGVKCLYCKKNFETEEDRLVHYHSFHKIKIS